MEDLSKLSELLAFPKEIVLLSHRNPDGDAIGSCLALSIYLQSKGHKTSVLFPSEYPLAFEWMPQSEEIIIYDLTPSVAENAINKAQLIFCLDFNSLDRIDKMGLKVHTSTVPKILIDHHLDPEPFADLVFSYITSSSTSEIVYQIIKQLEPTKPIARLVADCLYTGIMTDTGSFHHSTSAEVFRLMAELKENGLEDTHIQELVNNSQPDKYLKLLGHCLHNRMELIPEWNLGIIYLNRDDYRTFDIQRGDTEGIINYLMMLKSIKVGILVMNQPSIVKLSMRSKGDFSVQAICREHFNGGGHRNASGGASRMSLEETIKKIKDIFPGYVFANQLN
ncbi:MAG: DHH family phosphoesterase [Saprospiraceae bacterium]|nr:DHH family phosphoesterase [Candidatus Vicinibacter affinis]MBP6174510.1 DHH family phosphoesterase [Saprospiraceae bacterium]MBK6572468.1 DHH family phosphoesterase [Candidatus Vicinibacter affinis]MBK7304251.1 DHH family phosphoesterase [Candidatus Vicinibacter affinis]MBK8404613.1 DHH family phosphoesterase [Candidatus Vicinibacter affinis]